MAGMTTAVVVVVAGYQNEALLVFLVFVFLILNVGFTLQTNNTARDVDIVVAVSAHYKYCCTRW